MHKRLGNFDVFHETADLLDGDGALLVAGDPPNLMTIGWATLGRVWGRDIFQVFVRPSRYTYQLLENAGDFSVCFLSSEYTKELAICGTRTGYSSDKSSLCGFTMEKGLTHSASFVSESIFHYECRIIHKHKLDPSTIAPGIMQQYYPSGNFHMVYYGEVLGVFRH
jgi:flavin reductase (DIM6/NTAB) family NADH-FMN oxidoreductase RutF